MKAGNGVAGLAALAEGKFLWVEGIHTQEPKPRALRFSVRFVVLRVCLRDDGLGLGFRLRSFGHPRRAGRFASLEAGITIYLLSYMLYQLVRTGVLCSCSRSCRFHPQTKTGFMRRGSWTLVRHCKTELVSSPATRLCLLARNTCLRQGLPIDLCFGRSFEAFTVRVQPYPKTLNPKPPPKKIALKP